jgi:O-6-methylguanine DNA methyltransferase
MQNKERENYVYELCKQIPFGHFSTYKKISELTDISPRVIGQILKRNPDPSKIPCHRVIKSDFSSGGFFGNNYSLKKIKLMREGLNFDSKGYLVMNDRSMTVF